MNGVFYDVATAARYDITLLSGEWFNDGITVPLIFEMFIRELPGRKFLMGVAGNSLVENEVFCLYVYEDLASLLADSGRREILRRPYSTSGNLLRITIGGAGAAALNRFWSSYQKTREVP